MVVRLLVKQNKTEEALSVVRNELSKHWSDKVELGKLEASLLKTLNKWEDVRDIYAKLLADRCERQR